MSQDHNRQCSYDWIRDRDGKPKQNANGTYTMMEKMGACFTFTLETIDDVMILLDEIELIHLDDNHD